MKVQKFDCSPLFGSATTEELIIMRTWPLKELPWWGIGLATDYGPVSQTVDMGRCTWKQVLRQLQHVGDINTRDCAELGETPTSHEGRVVHSTFKYPVILLFTLVHISCRKISTQAYAMNTVRRWPYKDHRK